MKKSVLGIVAVSMLFVSPVFAEDASPVDSVVRVKDQSATEIAPDVAQFPVLQKLKDEAKGNVEFDYVGKEQDAHVWLISGDKIMQLVHVLPSGAAIIGGTMVSPEGKELTTGMQKKFADTHRERAQEILNRVRVSLEKAAKEETNKKADPAAAKKSAAETSEMIWTRMKELGVVHYGADKDAPVMYMVIDPSEEASQKAFAAVDGMATQNKLDLRIVPISIGSSDTVMQLATIMGSETPSAGFKDLIAGKQVAASKEPPNPQGVVGLKNNADFIQALKITKLPAIFYRKTEKDPIRVVSGLPKDWSYIFKELNIE